MAIASCSPRRTRRDAGGTRQGHSPWTQPKIRYGIALGLGVKGPDEIDVRSEGIQEIAALGRLMA